MNTLRKFIFGLLVLSMFQMSAQETESSQNLITNTEIESFQLPTFSELSTKIASEYTNVRERLPNLENIGEHVDKSIRKGFLYEHSVFTAFHNLSQEYSILPSITQKRFQLRNTLNNIMFNGFDVTQLHIGGAYKNRL